MIRPSRYACLLPRFARDARGAVSIMAALMIVLGMGLGALVLDAGHLYLAKRRLQAGVDAAALAAVADTPNATSLAATSLTGNGFTTSATIETGNYNADPAIARNARFTAGASPINAVRVTKTTTQPSFLAGIFGNGGDSGVKATAIAAQIPAVSFAAGTGLGTLSNGQVNQLLGGLFGTTVSLSLVNYNALAAANADALTFLDQLASQAHVTAGTYGDLANANVTVGQMIAAAKATLNIQGGSNAAALDALTLLSVQLPQSAGMTLSQVATTALWKTRKIGSVLQQHNGRTVVNLFDMVAAMARVYGAGRLATLGTAITLPINGTGTTTRLAVGSPMTSVGLSPVGTTIASSQIRMSFSVTLLNINLAGNTVNIGIPVYLQIASGNATATAIPCTYGGTRAIITAAAQAGVAQINNVTDANFRNFAADPPSGSQTQVATVTLLGIPISITSNTAITIAGSAATPLNFTQSQIDAGTAQSVAGSDAGKVFSRLASSLTLNVSFNGGALTTTINNTLNTVLLPLLKPVLVSILQALDPAADTLLRALGLRLGVMDVLVHGVSCGTPTLVR